MAVWGLKAGAGVFFFKGLGGGKAKKTSLQVGLVSCLLPSLYRFRINGVISGINTIKEFNSG